LFTENANPGRQAKNLAALASLEVTILVPNNTKPSKMDMENSRIILVDLRIIPPFSNVDSQWLTLLFLLPNLGNVEQELENDIEFL